MKALALEHIERLSNKVAELEAMIAALKHLVDNCSDDDRPNCPILRDLAEGRQGDCAAPVENRFGVARVS